MSLVLHAENPARLVEEAFGRIWRERMAGLPIVNPALAVEAVGLQPWEGHWLGVLVTPWAMSVLLLPESGEAWSSVRGLQRRFVDFSCGGLAFLGGDEPGLGEYQTCSLFSPMERFASQAAARATARACGVALRTPPSPEPVPATPRQPARSRRRLLGLAG